MNSSSRALLLKIALVVLILLAFAAGWRWLLEAGVADADAVEEFLNGFVDRHNNLLVGFLLVAAYVVALLLVFPLTLLVMTTGALFGPWWGLFYAILGTLSSSAVTYWVGRYLGKDTLVRYQGERIRKISAYMSQRSIRAMTVVNFLPIAPFTLTNLMGGAVGMHFGRYMIGSALGIIPGLAAVTLLGSQLTNLLTADDNREILIAIAVAVFAILALYLVKTLYQRKNT